MARIAVRKETGKLFFDFLFQGERCREQTELPDSPRNRKRLALILERIETEIALGSFDYRRYFPSSRMPERLLEKVESQTISRSGAAIEEASPKSPTLSVFIGIWLVENEVRWRRTTRGLRRDMIRVHILPKFGSREVRGITRAELLEFRAEFAQRPGKQPGSLISPKTTNDVMGVLINILDEAADRYDFTSPAQRIKRLKVPRKDIQPFSLEEVVRIIQSARPDFRSYFAVRFFTGMRTGEVHGLKWRFVDFERRQILVRETFTHGEQDGTKTDGSMREIRMSQQVFDALKEQEQLTRQLGEYVFCTGKGLPLDVANFVCRVWNPLLAHLGFERRRPYQMRHTAATLWLAAGENPEWIARQLGHSTTEMLFRVYSRYVPNLTRTDGSAFERLLAANVPTAR